ncbi:unnamed protein product, partial [Rotaria sp. Silwood2]
PILQSTDEISSISDSILDRFCVDILPRIHENVKSLTVESVSMECILRADNYPNFTELKLYNFNKAIVSRYFLDWCSIIEYLHLISLDVERANPYYIEHFLNETKTRLPCLTKLKVNYGDLKQVTENFSRDEMRLNCGRVKRLIVERSIVYPEYVYHYFPLLVV